MHVQTANEILLFGKNIITLKKNISVTFIKSLRKSQDQCLRPLSCDDIQPSRVHDMGKFTKYLNRHIVTLAHKK